MKFQEMLMAKKEWRAHTARVKELPPDYQIVYKELQKYIFKIGPIDPTDGVGVLSGIVDLFAESAARGKGVLEVTGSDVAAFCDELLRDYDTYTDMNYADVSQQMHKAIKKGTNPNK